jgi:hypothetical protein
MSQGMNDEEGVLSSYRGGGGGGGASTLPPKPLDTLGFRVGKPKWTVGQLPLLGLAPPIGMPCGGSLGDSPI